MIRYCLLPLAAMFALAAPAHATERYETLAAAYALDEKCGFLTYLEHEALDNLATEAVDLSNLSAQAQKMGDDSLSKFYKAQADKAAATACTQENGTAIVAPVRGETLMELAVAAYTAVELDQKAKAPQVDEFGLPTFTYNTIIPPSAGQLEDANKIGNYVASALGPDNTPAFMARAHDLAANRIGGDPEGKDTRWSLLLYDVDYQARAELDKKSLVGAQYPWQRLRDAAGDTLVQRRGTFGHGYNGFVYLMVKDGAVTVSAQEDRKGPIAGQTGMRLYIRKPDAPTNGTDNLPLTWSAAWRSQARAFDLKPAAGTAFGGPVYTIPPEALAALQALNDDDRVEIAIVQGTEDQAAMYGSSRCTFDIGPIKEALKPAS